MSVVNAEQFAAWNGASGHAWGADADRRDQVIAPIAEVLLDSAAPRVGERVLDVGCGCGATTLSVADAVAPDGLVVGIDLSAPMLDVARTRARAAGLGNVRFVQGDAQVHRAGTDFDLAVSRFGTMFFGDPVAAFASVGAQLRPGGRMCIVTWQPLADNEWLLVPGAALLEFGSLPQVDANAPGMFAQADPVVIRRILRAAGFEEIAPVARTVALSLGETVDDAVSYLSASGPGRAVLDTVPTERRGEAVDAVRRVVAPHAGPHGVRLRAGVWVTTACRPQ